VDDNDGNLVPATADLCDGDKGDFGIALSHLSSRSIFVVVVVAVVEY
jgi:hypothetical protein